MTCNDWNVGEGESFPMCVHVVINSRNTSDMSATCSEKFLWHRDIYHPISSAVLFIMHEKMESEKFTAGFFNMLHQHDCVPVDV